MGRPAVRILGDGIAGYAAKQALRAQSIQAFVQSVTQYPSPRPLGLVLDETAIRLIRDLFGTDVFAGAQQLRYRIVRWASGKQIVAQPAVSVRGSVFTDAIRRAAEVGADNCDTSECDWTLFAAAVAADREDKLAIGRRVTLACEVGLSFRVDASACHVESTSNGWAFLAPLGGRRALLQVTIPHPPFCNLEKAITTITEDCSPTLRSAGESVETPVAVMSSAPWMARTLGGENWIRMGSAAVRFDPICGDGIAQSLRTGLLAAACTGLALTRKRPTEAVDHYECRVARTFEAHLRGCTHFYAGGCFGPSWDAELAWIQNAARTTEPTGQWEPSFALCDGALVDTDQLGRCPIAREESWIRNQTRP